MPLRKTNTRDIVGTAGVREILRRIAEAGYKTPAVCIGGINASNIQRVFYQCSPPNNALDGVAVVSAIMAAADPEAATKNLAALSRDPPAFTLNTSRGLPADADGKAVIAQVAPVIQKVHETTPLSHNMTNLVSVLSCHVWLFCC